MTERAETVPEVQCPIRLGEACRLCQVGATRPEDCGLVYLVMTDDELREGLLEAQRKAANSKA